jgi:hypothetical protein
MDVDTLRELLMEIGTEQWNESTDERRTVTTSNKVYVHFGRIVDVIGVWLAGDVQRENNLALSGSHNKVSIDLDVTHPAGTEVLVSYISRDGLNDKTAQIVIDWAEVEVMADLHDFDLDLHVPKNPLERAARVYWDMLTLFNTYLVMNGINFIQSDGNISLFSYQQMSKIWGEGMSTEALFIQLRQRIEMVRRSCFKLSHEADYSASPDYYDAWNDRSMIRDWFMDMHTAYQRNPNMLRRVSKVIA